MPRPSPGCAGYHPAYGAPGTLTFEEIRWEEPGLPAVQRKVLTYLPKSADGYLEAVKVRGLGKPLPLVLVFHGWGGHGIWYHHTYGFGELAERAGFLAVYPEGLDDTVANESKYTSWNAVGTVDSNQSWQNCDVDRTTTGLCYKSCKLKKGKCHTCDWTTCYDDVGFVRKLLQELSNKYCVDLDRIYAYGCSNGGLFAHQLVQSMPEHFAAIAAACGGKPHRGYERHFKRGGDPVSMMLLQGLDDHTIPAHTPEPAVTWWDGFYYADEEAVLTAYKDYNGCRNSQPRDFSLPLGAGSEGLSCTERGYLCAQGASVVGCRFNAGHDVVTETASDSIPDGPQTAWFFLCQHSRTGAIPASDCVFPQPLALPQLAATAPRHDHLSMLGQAGVGAAFLVFGLGIYFSHKAPRKGA